MLASCSTPKDIVYFQDMSKPDSQTTVASPQTILLRPQDKITIIINSKDKTLAEMFNLKNTSGTGGGQNQLSYTIDKDGFIDIPVIGKISVNGLSRNEVAEKIKEELITKEFIKETLNQLIDHGADIIRLDAFAYAVKKLDSNDFFVEPEIWDLLAEVRDDIAAKGAMILPEIHEHYSMPFKISKHGYFIYDFALPMVTLYSLYSGKSKRLADWLNKCPMKQFTTLDTHDGIGVVDARDILSPDEVDYTSQELYKVGANVKKKYSSAEYHNLDIYQINTTFYSALGDNDKKYFIARLLQVFAPGIPQVYYVGMLAGKNDIKLLEETKEGRNINRHYYSRQEVSDEVKRPVVAKLLNLFRFRNTETAFDLDGKIKVTTPSDHEIRIIRMNHDKSRKAELHVDLQSLEYEVSVNGKQIDF